MSIFLLNGVVQEKERKHACVCVTLHIHVEMDGGDVMSGIDPLNMAPSHHNDDVIHRFTDRGGGIVAAIEILGVLRHLMTPTLQEDLNMINEDGKKTYNE